MPQPNGQLLDLRHSSELRVGDIIYVTFGITHAGYWKFGSEESLTVIRKTRDGKVRMKAEDGTIIPAPENPPIGGSKAEMLAELAQLSSYKEVRLIRPFTNPAPVRVRVPVRTKGKTGAGNGVVSPGSPVIFGLSLYGIMLAMADREDEREKEVE